MEAGMREQFGNRFSISALFVIVIVMTVILSACGGSQAPVASPTPRDPNTPVSFSKDIMPILQTSCVKCHGGEKTNRGLDLTTYDKLMAGSVRGAVVTPGDAEGSPLYQMIQQGKMPKQGSKLTADQMDLIKGWIADGAHNN
jgi:Planctomycete cytochrome C